MNTSHTVVSLALVSLGWLVACGGDNPGTGPNTTITVSGLVRERGGEPMSGVQVVVAGKSPVTTDADGRFSIPGVAVPYDLTVMLTSSNTALVYKGLTRADPALLSLDFSGADQTATISGTTPPTSGPVTFVFFQSGRHVIGGGVADAATGQYAITPSWRGSATARPGQLYALQFTRGPTPLPASYNGYASKPLTITPGGDFAGNNFAAADLIDPLEQSIGGTVTVPASYSLTFRRLYLFFGRVPLIWTEQAPLPNAFTDTVPAVGGVVFGVATWSVDPASRESFFFKQGLSGNSSNAGVPLEPAAQLGLPLDGAASVDAATPFTWGQGGGSGVNLFEVIPADASNPTFFVFTMGSDAKIPDLAGAGMALPASASYRWFVDRVFPVSSVNEVAAEGFLRFVDLETGDLGETVSEGRSFTTRAAPGTAFRGSAVGPTAVASHSPHRRGWMLTRDPISMDDR